MTSEELKKRTKAFALRCVKLAGTFPKTNAGNVISKQLIRSSTSVAANYRAACIAQSKKSFVSKLSIVVEEADESNFWLEFAKDENLLVDNELMERLINESKELTSIFIASRKTAQESIKS